MLSIIVPAYNEEEGIVEILKELKNVFKDEDVEIICVDDGSKDKTVELAKTVKEIKVVNYQPNKGKDNAFYTGYKEAKGEWIGTIDSDLTYPPVEMLKMYNYVKNNHETDIIIGSRFKKGFAKGLSLPRNLVNKLGALFFSLIFLKKITDLTTGLRIFKRKVSEIKVGTSGKVYGLDYEAGLSGEVIKRKMKYIEMAIESRPRAGQSKLAFFKNIFYFSLSAFKGRWL